MPNDADAPPELRLPTGGESDHDLLLLTATHLYYLRRDFKIHLNNHKTQERRMFVLVTGFGTAIVTALGTVIDRIIRTLFH